MRERRHVRWLRWLRREASHGDLFAYLSVPVRVVCVCGNRLYYGTAPDSVDWTCRGCRRRWTWAGSREHWLRAVDGDRVIQLPAPSPEPLPADHPLNRRADQT